MLLDGLGSVKDLRILLWRHEQNAQTSRRTIQITLVDQSEGPNCTPREHGLNGQLHSALHC